MSKFVSLAYFDLTDLFRKSMYSYNCLLFLGSGFVNVDPLFIIAHQIGITVVFPRTSPRERQKANSRLTPRNKPMGHIIYLDSCLSILSLD